MRCPHCLVSDARQTLLYEEEEVRNRSLLRNVDERGRKRLASKYSLATEEGRVKADVSLSSAELYMDVFQHQLVAVAPRLQLEEAPLLEAGKTLILLWLGRGGLFVHEGRVRTRLQPLECTLWLTLAVCRLLRAPLSAPQLCEMALAGQLPFRQALQWERVRLNSGTPVAIDNSDLLGLYRAVPNERRRVFVPPRARDLYSAAFLRPASLVAGMEAVLALCELPPPPPLHSSVLWGAAQMLEALPPWTDAVCAAAMHFAETWPEHLLAAAVGTCLLRSLSLSVATLEELAAFVGRSNRPPERLEMRPNPDSRLTRQLLGILEVVAPPPEPAPLTAEPPLPRLPAALLPEAPAPARREAGTTLPGDAVLANLMARVCGCFAHEVWPCLDALERRLHVFGKPSSERAPKRARH